MKAKIKIKLKSKKAITRRFRLTKNGIVLHASSFNRHLKRKKNKSRQRSLNIMKTLDGKIAKKIATFLK